MMADGRFPFLSFIIGIRYFYFYNSEHLCVKPAKAGKCGRAKTMRKRYEWTRIFFENGEKKLRFQASTDTCGQGLTL